MNVFGPYADGKMRRMEPCYNQCSQLPPAPDEALSKLAPAHVEKGEARKLSLPFADSS